MSSNPISEIEKLGKDPKRLGTALLTGGQSEAARSVVTEVEAEVARSVEDGPQLEGSPAIPTEEDAEAGANEQAVKAASRRGRASTILGGGLLSSSGRANLSRRTLIGA